MRARRADNGARLDKAPARRHPQAYPPDLSEGERAEANRVAAEEASIARREAFQRQTNRSARRYAD